MSAGDGAKFPKSARLRKRPEFLSLSRGGQKIHSSHFVIIRKSNDKGEVRLGVTVSAKVGKAVVRNRLKRHLREFFRRNRREIAAGEDILVVAKKGAGELSGREVAGEVRENLLSQRRRRT